MATAQNIIDTAAKQCDVLARGGQTLKADITDEILDLLNRMLAGWRNKGIDLGIPTLTTSATIIVDEADEEAIILQLEMRIRAAHNRPIPSAVASAASGAFRALQAKYAIINEVDLELPVTGRRRFNINVG